jgi:hypothetical protein
MVFLRSEMGLPSFFSKKKKNTPSSLNFFFFTRPGRPIKFTLLHLKFTRFRSNLHRFRSILHRFRSIFHHFRSNFDHFYMKNPRKAHFSAPTHVQVAQLAPASWLDLVMCFPPLASKYKCSCAPSSAWITRESSVQSRCVINDEKPLRREMRLKARVVSYLGKNLKFLDVRVRRFERGSF